MSTGMDKAMKYIKTIAEDFEEGVIYEGKVTSIKEFGFAIMFLVVAILWQQS